MSRKTPSTIVNNKTSVIKQNKLPPKFSSFHWTNETETDGRTDGQTDRRTLDRFTDPAPHTIGFDRQKRTLHDRVLGTYFCMNMALITLSSFLAVIVINTHIRGDRTNAVPRWLKRVS